MRRPSVTTARLPVDGVAPYTSIVKFRRRLLRTLEAIQPVLEEAGVLVVGSEVPNLLEPDVAATLVVSQDVDLAIPVLRHAAVMRGCAVCEVSIKLLTDRSGEKGERDLLVALGLLVLASEENLSEIDEIYASLAPELRHTVRSNLAILSLMEPRPGMPDPGPHRAADRRSASPAGTNEGGLAVMELLEKRLRAVRSRAAIRAWEYRQRNTPRAHGIGCGGCWPMRAQPTP